MKTLNKIKYKLITSLITLPGVTSAQPMALGYLQDFYSLLTLLPTLLFGLSVIYFFWGTGQFILHAGDEKTRADGKNKMIWGIVALTVFVSIYSILNLAGRLVSLTP